MPGVQQWLVEQEHCMRQPGCMVYQCRGNYSGGGRHVEGGVVKDAQRGQRGWGLEAAPAVLHLSPLGVKPTGYMICTYNGMCFDVLCCNFIDSRAVVGAVSEDVRVDRHLGKVKRGAQGTVHLYCRHCC